MARELLAMTGEFPDTKSGMLILLTVYRYALCDIATETVARPVQARPPKAPTWCRRAGRTARVSNKVGSLQGPHEMRPISDDLEENAYSLGGLGCS